MKQMLYIGSDHAGYSMKKCLMRLLEEEYYNFEDCGCFDASPVDYPDFAKAVVLKVLDKPMSLGILLCGSGIGVSITANRYKGIRAALCWNTEIAKLSRQHNDANILCLPARFLTEEEMKEIVNVFLNIEFEGGRHSDRIKKIENE